MRPSRTSERYFYTGISITSMVRPILTPEERERGRLLGAALRAARGHRSMVDVAAAAGVPVETLRKIETGRIVTPAFFTVAALAHALDRIDTGRARADRRAGRRRHRLTVPIGTSDVSSSCQEAP